MKCFIKEEAEYQARTFSDWELSMFKAVKVKRREV